jgi:4-diphosphocytidyl-2-C-methyl-D-erythritol kinase
LAWYEKTARQSKEVLFLVIFRYSVLHPIMFRAYAKINIGLYVVERRPDGYHNIETVFHRIDLWDELAFDLSPAIEVRATSPDVPEDASNICHKAARLLQDHLGISTGVRISLRKQIPVGAGLGGGSADGAVVLRELPAFWGRVVDETTLRRLALELGSDVPFFLGRDSAVAGGRGEILHYFPLDIPFTILLCYPNIHVTTGWAYERITPGTADKPADLRQAVLQGVRDPSRLGELLRNDFEPVVFASHPAVAELKQTMIRGGAVFSLMSGSGSSVYGFFRVIPDAERVAASLAARGFRTSITSPHFHV